MTNKKTTESKPQDIPHQIFAKFIEDLAKTDISTDVIDRLKKLLTAEDVPSEQLIRAALFTDPQNL